MSNKRRTTVISIRNASPDDFGGGEKVPVIIAKEIMKISPTANVIVCSGSKKLLAFAKAEHVKAIKTWWWKRQNWSGRKVLLLPLYIFWQIILTFYYVILFTRLHAHIVHIQSKDDFIAGTLAARLTGKRVFWSDYADLKHIWKNHDIWYKNPIGKMVFLAAHFAKTIIVVSKEDKRLILKNFRNPQKAPKLTVIHNGAFDEYSQIAKNNGETIFIASSRLVIGKGMIELVEAFNEIPDAKARLWLMGDGPDRALIESAASKNKRITFLGNQLRPFKYMQQATIFVHPTYHEGFSLSLVEAAMLKMPIIATKVGGNLEIIENGVNGLLVPAKDATSLRLAMVKLLNDPTLRDKLAENARKTYLDKFNFARIIKDDFLPLYSADH